MKSDKFHKYSKYYIQYFIIGAVIFGIISLFMKDINIISRIIFVILFALAGSILFGSLFSLSNRLIRPKITKRCLNSKKFKKLENIGLDFNDLTKGYFGTYRDFDVQVVYNYDEFDIYTSVFIISIVFQREMITKAIKRKLKDSLFETKIDDYFIQRVFRIKFSFFGKIDFKDSIDRMTDFLVAENFKPIRLSELENQLDENVT